MKDLRSIYRALEQVEKHLHNHIQNHDLPDSLIDRDKLKRSSDNIRAILALEIKELKITLGLS